jgi:uncharacterized protein YbaR (Trm112 family)
MSVKKSTFLFFGAMLCNNFVSSSEAPKIKDCTISYPFIKAEQVFHLLACPHCGQFRNEIFQDNPEEKEEKKIVECERCKGTFRIKLSKNIINFHLRLIGKG